ncbi:MULTISPECIES: TetR family transcriptional regulator C-terminal domain-containing protein [unclassified Shinella]|uniref:TetR family transcriptional regulator C-terminal domain-containing protein n=1 Tax=Shinella TaxID=323620 RepID=UPI00225D6D02|nr:MULTISPECIES: TetR family transcriptional regulator C-terminal domain-containing protein [unclassified Shinella]CAI0340857.1 Transcriptional regulator, TetR family [Rhizobiaceae bacterium]CAK7259202.1 TetR/AcrR family transcriptional regulator [Shinella sp. WSC3-e]MCO5136956.1 TetR family transcriptional regulator C-terminal domain-containing protein [Shinella sp.]MCW5706680.1 TetR family transcriptional regulator C-terminal domain-containing protein [Shinella sp.]MDC7253367.1 TetR family t
MSTLQKKRKEIHAAIRSAAIQEFARNGLSGTSTQAIAQTAGITKAQLHYYISSKEELYQQVLSDIVGEYKDIFFLSASRDDPALAITQYIERKVRHTLEFPDLSRFFANEIARGAPEMAPHWAALKAAVEEANAVIRQWIDSGKIAPVDPLLFQMNIWAVTQHYAEYEAQARVLMDKPENEPLDAERIIAEATRLFLYRCGLSGKKAETP